MSTGLFNSFTFGGSGTSPATVGVPIGSGIVMPAYRIAGITKGAMIIPNQDMYDEAIPQLNRLLASWNCDGHKIFNTLISTYDLTADQKIYTIGPGGDLDADRPVYVSGANLLFPTDPVVRQPIRIVDDEQWAAIAVQDIPGAPSYILYYDESMNSRGQGQIYLYFQPPSGYTLELYTWQALASSFTSQTDVAIFPPGYEHALVFNLAKNLASLNPEMQKMTPASYDEADRSLHALISLNSRSPQISCEPGLSTEYGPGFGWLDGNIR